MVSSTHRSWSSTNPCGGGGCQRTQKEGGSSPGIRDVCGSGAKGMENILFPCYHGRRTASKFTRGRKGRRRQVRSNATKRWKDIQGYQNGTLPLHPMQSTRQDQRTPCDTIARFHRPSCTYRTKERYLADKKPIQCSLLDNSILQGCYVETLHVETHAWLFEGKNTRTLKFQTSPKLIRTSNLVDKMDEMHGAD